MAERKVWFGVGSANGAQSPIYSLFHSTKSADVYVTGRAIGRTIKASLHKSGHWRFAYVENSDEAKALSEGANRAFVKWERPAPFEPGLTRARVIIVPPSVVTTWNAKLEQPHKVVWVPVPRRDSAVYFDVILSAPGWTGGTWNGGEWPGKNAAASTLLYSQLLANGETVWLVAFQRNFDEQHWISYFGLEPQLINLRWNFFAVHKTGGYGVYVEAPMQIREAENAPS